jgi:hypothetical protein
MVSEGAASNVMDLPRRVLTMNFIFDSGSEGTPAFAALRSATVFSWKIRSEQLEDGDAIGWTEVVRVCVCMDIFPRKMQRGYW